MERGRMACCSRRGQAGFLSGGRSARMSLLADLEKFVSDHRPHGGMTGDATTPARNRYLLTVTCRCGVVFERWVTPEDADVDLIRSATLN